MYKFGFNFLQLYSSLPRNKYYFLKFKLIHKYHVTYNLRQKYCTKCCLERKTQVNATCSGNLYHYNI